MLRSFARSFSSVVVLGAFAALPLLPSGARAQALYTPPGTSTTFPVGNTPQGIAAADFALTGYQGAVATNKQSNNMTVYLGAAAGTLGSPVTVNTCSGPTAVVATDLNNDGYPDIAVTCSTANAIEVFLNNGAGGFNSNIDGITTIEIPVGSGPNAIVIGDLNGDGRPDLAVANHAGGTATLLLSNAGSGFTGYTAQTISGLGSPSGIAIGDFNKDNHLDLAVSDNSSSNSVHVLFGDGTGSFTASAKYTVGTNPTGVVSADFNHDGNLDLAVSNQGSNNVSILLGSAAGTFTVQASPPTAGQAPTGLLVTDVNSDGNPDVVAFDSTSATPNQGSVAILVGNGNGTFQTTLIENLSDVPGTQGVVADFNRDGKPDLGIVTQLAGNVELMLNNTLPTPQPGGRSFAAPATVTTGNGNMADGIAVGDFNKDGKLDVAVSYLQDNAVRVMLGTGTGSFSAAQTYAVGHQVYWIAAGDLNGDGYTDLVTTNTADKTISVLLNKGAAGGFAAAQTYNVGWLPYQVAIGDLNGDNIPDLAVTNYGDNTVSVLFGHKNGTFTAGPTLTSGINPYGVVIGDFRHNGHNDIAVTSYKSAQLYVYLGNGDGTFQAPEIASTDTSATLSGKFPTSLVVGDFNRDGKLDIVTGNSIGNTVSFFQGNGNGTFHTAVVNYALNFPDSIAAGDINGDGILDIVSVAPNYNQVAVTLGAGDGTFGAFKQRAEFSAGSQPWAVALGDFNNDGKLDIVTANTFNRVNLTIPAYQAMYETKFPAVGGGVPSVNLLLNTSGTNISLTINPNDFPLPDKQAVTFTAKVTPALGGASPTGSVFFEDNGGTLLGVGPSTLANGATSLTLQNLGSGQHVITTLYSGDTSYQPNTAANGSLVIGVNGTPVTLIVSPSSVPYGGTFNANITVQGTGGIAPTGTVTLYAFTPAGFEAQSTNLTLTSNGNGTSSVSQSFLAVTPLAVGNYELYAVYNGNGRYQTGSSPNEPLTITVGNTTMTLNCAQNVFSLIPFTFGDSMCYAQVLDATGTPIQTGNVTFTIQFVGTETDPIQFTLSLSPFLADYYATDIFTSPTGPSYTVTAVFPAQGSYTGSSASGTFCTGNGVCASPAVRRTQAALSRNQHRLNGVSVRLQKPGQTPPQIFHLSSGGHRLR